VRPPALKRLTKEAMPPRASDSLLDLRPTMRVPVVVDGATVLQAERQG
jgi:hypothetical protein